MAKSIRGIRNSHNSPRFRLMLQVFEVLPIDTDPMIGKLTVNILDAKEILLLLNAYNLQNLSIILKVITYLNMKKSSLKLEHATAEDIYNR